jgi:hypothetical protein
VSEYYYLVSQLPDISSADEKSVLPITEQYYRDLCMRFLKKDEMKVIDTLSLVPPQHEIDTGSQFLNKWYEKERNLRLALAQIRAQKMKKDFDPLPGTCTADIMQAARTAVGMDSPLSAEQFLFSYRMSMLNEIQSYDLFSTDAVYAYGIRLMLVQRMKKFDREKGKASYHKIYESILGETI